LGAKQLRPDTLEYLSHVKSDTTEQAFFGEINYQVTEALAFTIGARLYDYDVEASSAVDLPLFYTLFGYEGDNGEKVYYAPDEINLNFAKNGASDQGNLFKFNVSYQFSNDIMAYATVSEGFRIGGSNGVAACPEDIDNLTSQIVCSLPDEALYGADTTTNYELGFKSTWFNNRFHFNAAVYLVEWEDAQVAGVTEHGQQSITVNADGAQSTGVEISSRAMLTDSIIAYATYSYTKAELTSDAPGLFRAFKPEDIASGTVSAQQVEYYQGNDGDRLPGSPEQQFSLGVTYSTEVFGDKHLDISYGLTYQDDVFSTVRLQADGEKLPGYSLSNLSARLSDETWSLTLYADNMFDKYAYSSVRRDVGDIGQAKYSDQNSNPSEILPNYGHYLVSPRKIGLKFEYLFEL